MINVKMRNDLEDQGGRIPAYVEILEDESVVGETYLNATDLEGAYLIGDNNDDSKACYWFEHIKLKDGRALYAYGIDLDYLPIRESEVA